jgi:hypothetical protein
MFPHLVAGRRVDWEHSSERDKEDGGGPFYVECVNRESEEPP